MDKQLEIGKVYTVSYEGKTMKAVLKQISNNNYYFNAVDKVLYHKDFLMCIDNPNKIN